MKISSIELNNWRAFTSAIFDFTIDQKEKNCVLIGAPNGFGKTSIFEAITLCLYGKKGLPLLARASMEGESNKLIISYNNFLKDVIHREALKSSSKLSVKITFMTSEGINVWVERHWHFNSSGFHRPGDEEFIVNINNEFKNHAEGQDREEWETEIISEYFVPHSLARFFLFDGEMVRDFAKMDMASKVRQGIKGLLGIPILEDLIDDLDKYSTFQRGQVKIPKNTENQSKLASDLNEMKIDYDRLNGDVSNLQSEISTFDEQRKNYFIELSSLGTLNSEKQGDLYQEINDLKILIEKLNDKLQFKLYDDFAIGLAGNKALLNTISLLSSDQTLEDWESSRKQGQKGYDNFLNSINNKLKNSIEFIPSEYHQSFLNIVKDTWGTIWHPKPEGCGNNINFIELTGSVRMSLQNYLLNLLNTSGIGLENMFMNLNKLQSDLDSKVADVKNMAAVGPRHQEITKEVKLITDNIDERKSLLIKNQHLLEVLTQDMTNKKATLHLITNNADRSQPYLIAAKRAESVKLIIEDIIRDMVPLQTDELIKAMTRIYKKLANKKNVEKIIIEDSLSVQLLDAKGFDLRKIDMSAGEEQIFSQALISAVVEVSNFDFPMIIDTPLARLDDDHRTAILRYFKSSSRQTIFLSTDTEISGKYYDEIKPNVSDTYVLENISKDGLGYTSVKRSYF